MYPIIKRISIIGFCLVIHFFLFASRLGAQCPNVVACQNGNFHLTYTSLPSPIPTTIKIIHNGTTYNFNISSSNICCGGLFFPSAAICSSSSNGGDPITVIFEEFNNLTCQFENNILQSQSGGQAFECPVALACLEHAGWVTLEFDEQPFRHITEAAFYFDNQVCANGTYYFHQVSMQNGQYYVAFEIPCSGNDLNGTVVLWPGTSYEEVCVFQNSTFCPACPSTITDATACEGLLENCGDELVNLSEAMLGSQCIQWDGDCVSDNLIYRMGPVGIGFQQAPPWHLSNYSLLVKGDIRTEQFKVCTNEGIGWCDYVFEKDYNLPSLKQVEAYIKQYRHLPGMPSEATLIQNGGIELGTMTLQQQEKIEEAFLYLININRQLNDVADALRSF